MKKSTNSPSTDQDWKIRKLKNRDYKFEIYQGDSILNSVASIFRRGGKISDKRARLIVNAPKMQNEINRLKQINAELLENLQDITIAASRVPHIDTSRNVQILLDKKTFLNWLSKSNSIIAKAKELNTL
jgi:hypothetical protein